MKSFNISMVAEMYIVDDYYGDLEQTMLQAEPSDGNLSVRKQLIKKKKTAQHVFFFFFFKCNCQQTAKLLKSWTDSLATVFSYLFAL